LATGAAGFAGSAGLVSIDVEVTGVVVVGFVVSSLINFLSLPPGSIEIIFWVSKTY
jgi:hypothetical protein